MKIFLPVSTFCTKENCDIYGDIIHNHEKKTDAIYVIETGRIKSGKGDVKDDGKGKKLRFLGQILQDKIAVKKHNLLCFRYDENLANIYLDTKQSMKSGNYNIFLYDPMQIRQLNESPQKHIDDISVLYRLLQDCSDDIATRPKKSKLSCLLLAVLNLPLHLMTRWFILFMEWKFVVFLLHHTAFYEHYKEWRKFYSTGKRNWNIALDKILGILVMLVLIFYVQEPSEYVITASHLVIDKLRLLLHSLKGSPIGLKLNGHLNNFLLDCFKYHIDLWATFLNIIEPSVQQLFVPITLLGSMGLSCQLALLADLLSVVSLHAHCFYIYAAVLYKVEIHSLQVLWKVVRGKRFNLLKKRVESHNYMNRQLYLATIFFTTLLFLFPTILVYYVVFTTLRLCICLVNWLLKTLRRRVLELPLQDLCEWWQGHYKDRDSIQLEPLSHITPSQGNEELSIIQVSTFKINVQSSSLSRVFSSESGVLQELTTNEDLTLKLIVKRILEGKF